MSEIGDLIQSKCMTFADRVIKLNDYLLKQAVEKEEGRRKITATENLFHLTTSIIHRECQFTSNLLQTSVTSCFVLAPALVPIMQKQPMR